MKRWSELIVMRTASLYWKRGGENTKNQNNNNNNNKNRKRQTGRRKGRGGDEREVEERWGGRCVCVCAWPCGRSYEELKELLHSAFTAPQLTGTKGRRAARRSFRRSRHMCRAILVVWEARSTKACLVFMEDLGLPLFRIGTMWLDWRGAWLLERDSWD